MTAMQTKYVVMGNGTKTAPMTKKDAIGYIKYLRDCGQYRKTWISGLRILKAERGNHE